MLTSTVEHAREISDMFDKLKLNLAEEDLSKYLLDWDKISRSIPEQPSNSTAEVTQVLLRNPEELRDFMRDGNLYGTDKIVYGHIREHFPSAQIETSLLTDPEDGTRNIEVRVFTDLSTEDSLDAQDCVLESISKDVSLYDLEFFIVLFV
jgi:hypothetical protein